MTKYLLSFVCLLFLLPAEAQLKSETYIQPYGSLSNTFFHIKKEKKIMVAFLGGSITHMDGRRDMVGQELEKKYPEVRFTFLNAGIPSLGSLPHAFRFQQDVLKKGKVDLLFIESAVNDKVNGTTVKTQRRALEGIVRQARTANPRMDIVMMAFVDPDKIADYQAGVVPQEVQVHQEIAQHYKLPFLNLAKEVFDRIQAKEFTWKDDFKDLHPSPFGQKLYFNTIHTLLQKEAKKKPGKKAKPHNLPKPLDAANYQYGHYLAVQNAYQLEGFTLVQDWVATDNLPTREHFVHVPVLEATKAGASFKVDFKGPLIGIGVLSGPDAGILEYSIDGVPYKPLDLYTQWSTMLHLPWYLMLADDLKDGQHTLEAKLLPSGKESRPASAARIVYFLENSPAK